MLDFLGVELLSGIDDRHRDGSRNNLSTQRSRSACKGTTGHVDVSHLVFQQGQSSLSNGDMKRDRLLENTLTSMRQQQTVTVTKFHSTVTA